MHFEKLNEYIKGAPAGHAGRGMRLLAVVLPMIGIITLSCCVKEFCSGWISRLPQGLDGDILTNAVMFSEPETDGTAQARTIAVENAAVVTFANANTENDGLLYASPVSANSATVQGCGLYIDGQFYGAYSSATNLRGILDSLKALYATGADGETVGFTRDIQLVEGTYPASDLLTYSGIKSVLESRVTLEKNYAVSAGDTLETIASYYGMDVSRLTALNASLSTDALKAGEILTVKVEEPLVQISCTRKVTETVSIPFETEIVEETSSSGKAEIITAGVNGSKTVTASIVTINGRETERTVLSETILNEPVTQQMTKGTSDSPSYSASYYGDTGSGVLNEGMIWPLPDNGGTITCNYGEDGHQGVDLAIAAGTDIYAAASGTVVVAGSYYTYGNCVVIDHGNGVRTLYAHCTALNVSVGDIVSQGDVVGTVGMTGYATGNHLHFEVHINNRTCDPLQYIAR